MRLIVSREDSIAIIAQVLKGVAVGVIAAWTIWEASWTIVLFFKG